MLFGELDADYEDEKKKVPPSFRIMIERKETEESRRVAKPIWEPEKKKVILGLARRIQKALQI